MERKEYEKKLKESMEDLKKAWNKCLDIFNGYDFDCNDYIVENYPFKSSFDEINVAEWCTTVIDNIKEKSAEQKETKEIEI